MFVYCLRRIDQIQFRIKGNYFRCISNVKYKVLKLIGMLQNDLQNETQNACRPKNSCKTNDEWPKIDIPNQAWTWDLMNESQKLAVSH